jgi:hypothetical protein
VRTDEDIPAALDLSCNLLSAELVDHFRILSTGGFGAEPGRCSAQAPQRHQQRSQDDGCAYQEAVRVGRQDLRFAAEDTSTPKRAAVKRRLVSKADVEKDTTRQLAKEEFAESFAQEELSMKKMGFLPRDFNLKEFLVKSTGPEIAAYYDDEGKTIPLLNWVPFDPQEPILAHELTHALQDQNYDLAKWMKAAPKPEGNRTRGPLKINGDSQIARNAVVEGQAMVVYMDYLLPPWAGASKTHPS